MKKSLAMFTADWHLRKRGSWLQHPTLRGDAEYALKQIAALAFEYDVSALLVGGDTFETPEQTAAPMLAIRELVDRLAKQDRAVYFVQGQHERSYPALMSAIHPWAQHIHKRSVELADGFVVAGLDYSLPDSVQSDLQAVPAHANVLLTHQVWRDYMGEQRGDASISWIPDNIKMVLTGDYHRAFDDEIDGKTIISPGPVCLQKLDEPPQKCVYFIEDDLTFSYVALRNRRIFREVVQTEEQLNELLDTWPDNPARIPQTNVPIEIATNILEVAFRVDVPNAKARIERQLRNQVHLFFSPIAPPEQLQPVAVLNPVLIEQGMEGCLREYYADKPDVLQYAIQLWQAQDADQAIDNIFKQASST